MTLCVYAVTSAHPALRGVRGMTGERLILVRAGSLAAVVGRLPRVPPSTTAALRRYDAVIRRLCGQRPALLPARFAMCFDGEHEIVAVLRERGPRLREALRHVRGRVQMTVRLPGAAGDRLRPATAPRPAGATRSRSGVQYLRARAAEAARRREIPAFEPVRHAVKRWVRDERMENRTGVVSIYHLVPHAAPGRYRRAAARAAAGARLRLIVSGPHPPYAFTEAS